MWSKNDHTLLFLVCLHVYTRPLGRCILYIFRKIIINMCMLWIKCRLIYVTGYIVLLFVIKNIFTYFLTLCITKLSCSPCSALISIKTIFYIQLYTEKKLRYWLRIFDKLINSHNVTVQNVVLNLRFKIYN